MPLGAYSIIRYSNNLSDQRVNLGLLVWHPVDGFAHRLTPSLDRAQAVDPRVRITGLKKQLDMIKGLLTQRQFENKVKAALASAVGKVSPKAKCEVIGARQVNGVSVDAGIRTTIRNKSALWHALSLQSKDRAGEQIIAAKAAAMEIVTIRQHLRDFKNARQIVVLQPPRPTAAEHLGQAIAWLKHEAADEVIPVGELALLPQVLEIKLQDLVSPDSPDLSAESRQEICQTASGKSPAPPVLPTPSAKSAKSF